MANNFQDRVVAPLGIIQGGLVGANLFSQLRTDMLAQNVFKSMFGANGERIFTDRLPSLNETIFPLIEFYWGSEIYGGPNTYLTGIANARIVLPTKVTGDTNFQRNVGAAFSRFLGSKKHHLFSAVDGLIEFGKNIQFQYDRLLQVSALTVPVIDISIPFKFDLALLRQVRTDVDFLADLDVALIGWVESYALTLSDDNHEVLISQEVFFETDQENP